MCEVLENLSYTAVFKLASTSLRGGGGGGEGNCACFAQN
jgi:hypothetical protein